MRKALIGAVLLVTLGAAALLFAPDALAQVRGRRITPGIEGLDRLMLQGPGSEIGLSVRELRSDEVSAARPEGVIVEEVRGDSPAARAGVRTGDVIVEFDGERVRSVRQFTRLVRETPPGRATRTTIVRDGSRQTLDVTPREAQPLSMALPDIGREIERGMRSLPRDFDFDVEMRLPASPARLGVTLTPLGDQLAAYFGATEGALVSAVESDSPAARAGIRAGDVITAIAGRAVREPGDAMAAIRDAAPGAAVDVRIVREKKELTVKATIPDRRPVPSRDRIPV